MANESGKSGSASSGQAGKTAAEKRSQAKQINAARLEKLDEISQRAVKVLRRTGGAIDTGVEALLNGKKPVVEVFDACAALESAVARIGLS